MPDLHSTGDAPVLYVLGQLPERERREFERRLAESAELRALVRELEEGLVGLSMAASQRTAPPSIWCNIKDTLRETEKRSEPVRAFQYFQSLIRSGWAAAAVCLIAWLIYAIRAQHAASPEAQHSPNSPEIAQNNYQPSDSGLAHASNAATTGVIENPSNGSLAQASEISHLHRRVWELENQVTQISRTLTQQDAILSESNQFRVFQLQPRHAGTSISTSPPAVSPELQRAFLLALARELARSGVFATNGDFRQWNMGDSNSFPGIQSPVQFVDLPRDPSEPSNQIEPLHSPEATATNLNLLAGTNAPGSIPAAIFGDKVVMVINSSVVPSNEGVVTFWTGNAQDGVVSVGSLNVGDDPIAVAVPFSLGAAGMNFFAAPGFGFSYSNVFIQFPPP